MRIVCISDTHGINHPASVPDGDVLIHAGDLSIGGEIYEIQQSLGWLRRLPHKHKIFIGGNHDKALAMDGLNPFKEQMKSHKGKNPLIYLENAMVEIGGLRIFGSPTTRTFGVIKAFMKSGEALDRHWTNIPTCDVLVTHGPPLGILDELVSHTHMNGKVTEQVEHLGCVHLLNAVREIKPKLHIFGHIHAGRGVELVNGTIFVNASMIDEAYKLGDREPIVVELP